jgi:hypothetical protein
MGKKPVLGLVGLFVGLTLSGCKDCGCGWWNKDKEPTPPTARMRKPKPDAQVEEATWREDTTPPEESIATRGGDPRRMKNQFQNPDTYNFVPQRGMNEESESTAPADTGAPMTKTSVPAQERMSYREQPGPVIEKRNPAALTSEQSEVVPPPPPMTMGPQRAEAVDPATIGAPPAPREMAPPSMMGGREMAAPKTIGGQMLPAKKNDGTIDISAPPEPRVYDLTGKGAPAVKPDAFTPPSFPPQVIPTTKTAPNPVPVEKPATGPEIISGPPPVPPPSN